MLEIEKIMSQLETDFIGREIHHFEKLSSTNTTAKQQARKGAKEGTAIIAETQTRGKGRLNRPWVSPKGGIWLSIILKPEIAVEDITKITLITSVAVAKTLREMFDLKAEIKWPNDVLIDSRKVCGILSEAVLKGKTVDFIIVGIGVNANFTRKALPRELQTTATTLKEVLKKDIDREIHHFVGLQLGRPTTGNEPYMADGQIQNKVALIFSDLSKQPGSPYFAAASRGDSYSAFKELFFRSLKQLIDRARPISLFRRDPRSWTGSILTPC